MEFTLDIITLYIYIFITYSNQLYITNNADCPIFIKYFNFYFTTYCFYILFLMLEKS